MSHGFSVKNISHVFVALCFLNYQNSVGNLGVDVAPPNWSVVGARIEIHEL